MPKLTLTESDICALLASYPTQHGSINLQGNIHIGFSGAAIWKVDVRARGSYQPDGFHIAKFNWHTDTSDGEIVDELDEEHTRHEVARRHALMRKFIPELVHDSGNLDGNIGFLLYQIAHDGTLGGVPFSAVLTQKRVSHRVSSAISHWQAGRAAILALRQAHRMRCRRKLCSICQILTMARYDSRCPTRSRMRSIRPGGAQRVRCWPCPCVRHMAICTLTM